LLKNSDSATISEQTQYNQIQSKGFGRKATGKTLSSGFFLVYFFRMKLQRLLFNLLISAAFLNACSNGNASGDVSVLFQPKYAKGFRVVKSGNDTLIQFLSHSHFFKRDLSVIKLFSCHCCYV
jgi:hypothetical protein